jgi:hypothetical protein
VDGRGLRVLKNHFGCYLRELEARMVRRSERKMTTCFGLDAQKTLAVPHNARIRFAAWLPVPGAAGNGRPDNGMQCDRLLIQAHH